MARGFVKLVKETGGFGFISQEGGPDVYFHKTEINGLAFDEQLTGRRVEFDVGPGRDGRLRACNVRAVG